MLKFLEKLADLIYKKQCWICRKSHENVSLCSKCFDEIELLAPCPITCLSGCKVYCAAIYENNIQKLLRAIKYHKKREFASHLAQVLYNYRQQAENFQNYTIVPVPLYKSREKKRGYNHMELVAKEFANLCGYSVNTQLLKRTKNTKPQFRLSISERKKNLEGAFVVDKTKYNGEKLLLLDDILTTGSTLCEMIKTLEDAGIKPDACLTISCTASHAVSFSQTGVSQHR